MVEQWREPCPASPSSLKACRIVPSPGHRKSVLEQAVMAPQSPSQSQSPFPTGPHPGISLLGAARRTSHPPSCRSWPRSPCLAPYGSWVSEMVPGILAGPQGGPRLETQRGNEAVARGRTAGSRVSSFLMSHPSTWPLLSFTAAPSQPTRLWNTGRRKGWPPGLCTLHGTHTSLLAILCLSHTDAQNHPFYS